MVQLSHPYMTTGKTVALTIWTFLGKVMCLLFHMLCRFAIVFLLRSKHCLILWLQTLSSVILEPRKNKICHCFHFFPFCLPWSDGTGISSTGFISWHFPSICLLQDLADRGFFLLLHLEQKYIFGKIWHPTCSNQMGFCVQHLIQFHPKTFLPLRDWEIWLLRSSVFYPEPWIWAGSVYSLVLTDSY